MTFHPERFAEIAAERRLGFGHPITFRKITGSTNDDALAAARDGAPHGALFVAESQTNGRGRRGNPWLGTPGQSALFTVLLRPSVAVERASGLALVGGLAVRAAVELWLRAAGQNEPALVKWPNDVVIGGRKVCGILAESQVRSSQVVAVVLGIGLNMGPGELPPGLAETATTLSAWGARNLDAETLVADVLTELEPRVEQFLAGGESTVAELRAHDALVGRRVRVGAAEGIAEGINRSGSLLLRDEKGALEVIIAGHVEVPPHLT
jgi:BirA family transcriptional regulator, biotin operon repressor / biotin---[acetyl-CoA-carboxylase] ligase